jgi:hypothetical protein
MSFGFLPGPPDKLRRRPAAEYSIWIPFMTGESGRRACAIMVSVFERLLRGSSFHRRR